MKTQNGFVWLYLALWKHNIKQKIKAMMKSDQKISLQNAKIGSQAFNHIYIYDLEIFSFYGIPSALGKA